MRLDPGLLARAGDPGGKLCRLARHANVKGWNETAENVSGRMKMRCETLQKCHLGIEGCCSLRIIALVEYLTINKEYFYVSQDQLYGILGMKAGYQSTLSGVVCFERWEHNSLLMRWTKNIQCIQTGLFEMWEGSFATFLKLYINMCASPFTLQTWRWSYNWFRKCIFKIITWFILRQTQFTSVKMPWPSNK